ncbi:MAG: hypothetical protein NT126_09925, partial [Bacteroidetes bacterium]|nr:hypothetical protein [Bacteroidota bacterium]
MISVEEAKQLLFAQIKKSTPIHAELVNANGCVLAEDIFSPIDLPSFNQSSMDGYAIAWASDPIKQFD